jgi:hypothetical protein
MDDLEYLMIKEADLTNVLCGNFIRESLGDFILFSKNKEESHTSWVSYVKITENKTSPGGSKNHKFCWIIENYLGFSKGFKIDGSFIKKEDFILTLKQKYPETLDWILFNIRWLE